MSNSKFLSDSGWKDVAAKNKVKDNGLLKELADYKRLGDDKHDDLLQSLDQIVKLATQLKKAKDVAAASGAAKYVGDVIDAAETERRAVVKAKADYDKGAKAEADKKAKAEADKGGGDKEDEEDEEASTLLTTKMVPLLRQVVKGETMHTLVASAGKEVVILLSRKPISPARRKLLADQLGVSGGVKYFPGHCIREEGMTTFVLKTEVAGMAKKLKLALLQQTGLRVKLRCRGEDGDTDEDLEESAQADGDESSPGGTPGESGATTAPATAMTRPFEITAAVGRGGKNLEEDVQAVQAALNRRADAGLKVDGRCGADTIAAIVEFQRALGQSKPDGRVDPRRGSARALAASGKIGKPPPAPNPLAPPEDLGAATLARAPEVWHGTRAILDHNIDELKRAIRQEYASEHPTLLAEIDQNVQRVDVILEKLDARLADTLQRAGATTNATQRKAEIVNAKTILADYVAFVKSEPLIDHIDKNPFGVQVQVRKTITDSLTHVIKSIA
jgi:hypothetical protein